jgi:hypothetical protein
MEHHAATVATLSESGSGLQYAALFSGANRQIDVMHL